MGLSFLTQDEAIRLNFQREKQSSCNGISVSYIIHQVIASTLETALPCEMGDK